MVARSLSLRQCANAPIPPYPPALAQRHWRRPCADAPIRANTASAHIGALAQEGRAYPCQDAALLYVHTVQRRAVRGRNFPRYLGWAARTSGAQVRSRSELTRMFQGGGCCFIVGNPLMRMKIPDATQNPAGLQVSRVLERAKHNLGDGRSCRSTLSSPTAFPTAKWNKP